METESQIEEFAKRLADADELAFSKVTPIDSSERWRKPRCPECQCTAKRYGLTASNRQRWKCPQCRKVLKLGWRVGLIKGFERGMFTSDLKVQIVVHLLAEGVGIRGAARVVGISKATVSKIHKLIGHACEKFLESRITDVAASEVEVDEVWTYIFKKGYTTRECGKSEHQTGSTWIYIGIDRVTKLILAHYIGKRTTEDACEFMRKLRSATVGQMTIYTDGFQPYPTAVYAAFLYENKLEALPDFLDHPAVVVRNNGMIGQLHETEAIDYSRSCTNRIERFNATLRQGLRRLSRRTQAFSKTKSGLQEGMAIFLAYYNFCKVHGSLEGKTPAMAAGLTEHVWTIRELIIEAQKVEVVDMRTGEVVPIWETVEVKRRAVSA